jgi:nucleotide-binding universal stress UspA family protein
MSVVLAAVDDNDFARRVIEVAAAVGRLTGADVHAVHARTSRSDPVSTPESAAAGIPFTVLEGSPESTLLAAASDTDVVAMVIGAGSRSGRHRPVGRTARTILEKADKPVVVVPPGGRLSHSIRRLLVPLEGTEISSRPLLEQLWPLLVTEVDVVVLHVFTDATLPTMLDRPYYDLEILGGEFLARHCPGAATIEFRTGPIGDHVTELCRDQRIDLVVLSWSQNPDPGRAHVIRDVLAHSALPVLLLPHITSNKI